MQHPDLIQQAATLDQAIRLERARERVVARQTLAGRAAAPPPGGPAVERARGCLDARVEVAGSVVPRDAAAVP